MTTAHEEHVSRPEFTLAVRGYDRTQVDDFVARAMVSLADAESRTAAAEARLAAAARESERLRRAVSSLEERNGLPAPASVAAFSERVAQVLQGAIDAADLLRRDTEEEARRRLDQVAQECLHALEQASVEAQQIVERARGEERSIDRQIGELAAKRAAALSELGRLHEQLAALIDDRAPTVLDADPAMTSQDATAVMPALVGEAHDDDTVVLTLPEASTKITGCVDMPRPGYPDAEDGAADTGELEGQTRMLVARSSSRVRR